jgi:regulator of nucleoside diphosphate kinase
LIPLVEENLWVIVQPAVDVPGQWRARCLNADIVSSSASPERALRALSDVVSICLAEGSCPRRRPSRDEQALLARLLGEGHGGTPPSGADILAAAQLEIVRSEAAGSGSRLRLLPWAWLERSALRKPPVDAAARSGLRASLGRARCGRLHASWSSAINSSAKGTHMSKAPDIIVTTQDFERLQRLVACTSSSAAERLDAELARARLVAQTDVPADVVTMNSDVIYEDAASGERRSVRLVYPKDAEAARGWVSVLAPVGSALLGLRQGQTIDWRVPRGTRRLRVLAVPYQPESHGHFAL